MEDSLRDFLISRQAVTEESLHLMEIQKIDIEAIMGMTSHDLKEYIPICGDRIAVINFCRRHSSNKKCANRTMSLLEKLKRGQKLSEEGETRPKKYCGRKPQISRKIMLGWVLNGTPVRQSKGGGSRDISVNKSSKKADLLKIAKDLFFPNGKSVHGRLENYECDLLDFQQEPLQDNLTVGEIYEITKINVLRFYLSTSEKKKPRTSKSYKYKLDGNEGEISNVSEFLTFKSKYSNSEVTTHSFDDQSEVVDQVPISILYEQESSALSTEQVIDLEFAEVAFPDNPLISVFDWTVPVIDHEHNDDPDTNSRSRGDIKLLKIHRGRVFEELLNAYQEDVSVQDTIKIEMVLPNGEIEKADDQGGVFRDTLTEFWNTFYEKCTVGTALKVPYLRHDFGEKQWKAVAKILIKGHSEENYFPIKLAPVFIENCLHQTPADNILIDNFKNFVSESDSQAIDAALNNFCDKNEDILDFFTMYESKWIPKADNVFKLIRDIAHKEMIQKPAFVGKCFMEEFKKQESFLDISKVRVLYEKLKPTGKNCLAQLKIEDEYMNSTKNEHFLFLKRFIKEGNDQLRSQFLRFCTGSDLPLKKIKVSFDTSCVSEFKRSPVAHTCTGLLVLPLTYENYVDFRNEFNSLLTSNIWVMDIV